MCFRVWGGGGALNSQQGVPGREIDDTNTMVR